MNKVYSLFFCIIISGCAGQQVSKPSLLVDAENYTAEAMQAYTDEEWGRAQRLLDRALSVYESLDHRKGTLKSYINLVEVTLAAQQHQLASQYLTKADAIVKIEALSYYQMRLDLLHALIAMQQQDFLNAELFLREILADFFAVGSKESTPNAVQLVAIATQTKIAFETNQDEALWLLRFEKALKQLANTSPKLKARLFRFQSKLLFKQGDYDASLAKLQDALKLYKKQASRTGIAETLLALANSHDRQNESEYALSYFERAITVFRSLGNDKRVNEVTARLVKIQAKIPKSDDL